MTVVWVYLTAIFGYEFLAILFGWAKWSDIIHGALKGHRTKQLVIFGIVILIAGHVIFGWFNHHHHKTETKVEAYDGY